MVRWLIKTMISFLEVFSSRDITKYTTVFNNVRRSNSGADCNILKNILECRGELCFIPTAKQCFRNELNKFTMKTSLQNTANSRRARIDFEK